MSGVWEVKQYIAVRVPELVNVRVKEWKCANLCIFTVMLAPGVAKGGSVFPQIKIAKLCEAQFCLKKCFSPVGPSLEGVGKCLRDS